MATVIRTHRPEEEPSEKMGDEELARAMERTSPDGRPGSPVLHSRGLYGLLWGAALLCVVGSAIVWALTGDRALAIAVLGFALLGGILASPAMISAVMRARERKEAEDQRGREVRKLRGHDGGAEV